jgi:hypothetical protein
VKPIRVTLASTPVMTQAAPLVSIPAAA